MVRNHLLAGMILQVWGVPWCNLPPTQCTYAIFCVFLMGKLYDFVRILNVEINIPCSMDLMGRYVLCTRWRFQHFFSYVHPLLGEMIQFDEHIFQNGLKRNHQLG